MIWISTKPCTTYVEGINAYMNKYAYKAKVMLRLTVSQSVCRGVKFTLELVTRYYFLSESFCVVSVERFL
jgi:hypothetical protein